jgi:hypothetical protein
MLSTEELNKLGWRWDAGGVYLKGEHLSLSLRDSEHYILRYRVSGRTLLKFGYNPDTAKFAWAHRSRNVVTWLDDWSQATAETILLSLKLQAEMEKLLNA